MDSDSSHSTEVTVEAEAWQSTVTDPVGIAKRAVAAALDTAAASLPGPPEGGVLLADDARVRELNRAWRGKDKPTNVLSFPAWEPGDPAPEGGPLPLGDVAVALETVLREAAAEGKTPEAHLAHLVVHGTLHRGAGPRGRAGPLLLRQLPAPPARDRLARRGRERQPARDPLRADRGG